MEKIFNNIAFIATPTTAVGTIKVEKDDAQCNYKLYLIHY